MWLNHVSTKGHQGIASAVGTVALRGVDAVPSTLGRLDPASGRVTCGGADGVGNDGDGDDDDRERPPFIRRASILPPIVLVWAFGPCLNSRSRSASRAFFAFSS